jgi:hypothetical protein
MDNFTGSQNHNGNNILDKSTVVFYCIVYGKPKDLTASDSLLLR